MRESKLIWAVFYLILKVLRWSFWAVIDGNIGKVCPTWRLRALLYALTWLGLILHLSGWAAEKKIPKCLEQEYLPPPRLGLVFQGQFTWNLLNMSFCCTDLLHIVMNPMICSVAPQFQGDGHYCTSSAPSKGGTTGMAGLYEDVMQKKLEKTWTWRKVPTDG